MAKIKVNGSTKLSKKPKTRVTSAHIAEARASKGRDTSPKWDGCETWDSNTFHRHFVASMDWYRLEGDSKTFKPAIVKWMESIGCAKGDVVAFKKLKDSRVSPTMGAIALCLLRGMTPQRNDFNNGKDSSAWLRDAIAKAIDDGKDDVDPEEKAAEKAAGPQISIQDRVREAALGMTEDIETALESFQSNPEAFNPKEFKVISMLRSKEAKAAHTRYIKDFYTRHLAELEELASGEADEQLREGYQHLSRKNVKKLIDFYHEIMSACDMLAQEAKVNRAPRAKKAVSKDKLVAKLKYKKQDEALKLVSINPVDVIGASELWVYNTKSRKLGKYVAAPYQELGIKGTSVTGFDENLSVMKTVRKPEEKLKEFKAAGKVALRKFLDDINATEARMNGRINEEIILLKVA